MKKVINNLTQMRSLSSHLALIGLLTILLIDVALAGDEEPITTGVSSPSTTSTGCTGEPSDEEIRLTQCDAYLFDTQFGEVHSKEGTSLSSTNMVKACQDLTADAVYASIPSIGDAAAAHTLTQIQASNLTQGDQGARCINIDSISGLRVALKKIFIKTAEDAIRQELTFDTIRSIARYNADGMKGLPFNLVVEGQLLVYGDLEIGNNLVVPSRPTLEAMRTNPHPVSLDLLPKCFQENAFMDKKVCWAPIIEVADATSLVVGAQHSNFFIRTSVEQCNNLDGEGCALRKDREYNPRLGKHDKINLMDFVEQTRHKIGIDNKIHTATNQDSLNAFPGSVLTGEVFQCSKANASTLGRLVLLSSEGEGQVNVRRDSGLYVYGDVVLVASLLSLTEATLISYCGSLVGSQCSCDGDFFSVSSPTQTGVAMAQTGSVGTKCMFVRDDESMDFEHAENNCHAAGGEVASVNNYAEHELSVGIIVNGNGDNFYLGGVRSGNNEFKWNDGSGSFPDSGQSPSTPFYMWQTPALGDPGDNMVLNIHGDWRQISSKPDNATGFICQGPATRKVPSLPPNYDIALYGTQLYRTCDGASTSLQRMITSSSLVAFLGKGDSVLGAIGTGTFGDEQQSSSIIFNGNLILINSAGSNLQDDFLLVGRNLYSWASIRAIETTYQIGGDVFVLEWESTGEAGGGYVHGDFYALNSVTVEGLLTMGGDLRADGYRSVFSKASLYLEGADVQVRGNVRVGEGSNLTDANPVSPAVKIRKSYLTIDGPLGFYGRSVNGLSVYPALLNVDGSRIDVLNGPFSWNADVNVDEGHISSNGDIRIGGVLFVSAFNGLKIYDGLLVMTAEQLNAAPTGRQAGDIVFGEVVKAEESNCKERVDLEGECGRPSSTILGEVESSGGELQVTCNSCLTIESGLFKGVHAKGGSHFIVNHDLIVDNRCEAQERARILAGNQIIASQVTSTTRSLIQSPHITAFHEETLLGGRIIQHDLMHPPTNTMTELYEANYCRSFIGDNLISTPSLHISTPDRCFLQDLFTKKREAEKREKKHDSLSDLSILSLSLP
eukprot:GHVN01094339.1.p1 GENE.GHVN01094339.1~~GHVN01094339.1.p1  ORF type:complete len:1088 (-),score=180.25 GHVN01094339.1:474-3659(-)